MNQILNLYKPEGLTPLAAINLLKQLHPEYAQSSCTYAGRLDPMAAGVLIVLTDDTIYKKNEYLGLNKTYKATILLGVGTDTGDILGIPTKGPSNKLRDSDNTVHTINGLVGEISLPLPAYASVPVDGKPLHIWARSGQIDQITIPTRTTNIESITLIQEQQRSSKVLFKEIQERIIKVDGDFRQSEIVNRWESVLSGESTLYTLLTIRVTVTSGTYIRSLAEHIGSILGTNACLFKLLREQVGPFNVADSITLE